MATWLSELENIGHHWGKMMLIGLLLIVLGSFAAVSSTVATFATVMTFGWLLILGGLFEIGMGLWIQRWRGFLLSLFVGILYLSAGIFILKHPFASAAGFTMLVAFLLLTGGLFRLVTSFAMQYPGWAWSAFDGALSVVLSVLILAQWPSSSLWVIGLFLGISLFMRGLTWVVLASHLRHIHQKEQHINPWATRTVPHH